MFMNRTSEGASYATLMLKFGLACKQQCTPRVLLSGDTRLLYHVTTRAGRRHLHHEQQLNSARDNTIELMSLNPAFCC
jgi:hypothetical protein